MKDLKLLIEKRSNQRKVALETGISPQTLSNYINDKTQPDIETLIKLADYFNTTTDKILGHEVPYLIDVSTLSSEKIELIKQIINLNDEYTNYINAYLQGILVADNDRKTIIDKFKR